MKKGRTLEIVAGKVFCPAKHEDRSRSNCFGCEKFVGMTALVVMCARKGKVKAGAR